MTQERSAACLLSSLLCFSSGVKHGWPCSSAHPASFLRCSRLCRPSLVPNHHVSRRSNSDRPIKVGTLCFGKRASGATPTARLMGPEDYDEGQGCDGWLGLQGYRSDLFSLGNCSSHHICSNDSTPPRGWNRESRNSRLLEQLMLTLDHSGGSR